jgi:hypothetical protein
MRQAEPLVSYRICGFDREPALIFAALCMQAKETCDYQHHDHHTDDVKDVHCTLLQERDAIRLRVGHLRLHTRLVLS